MKSLVNSALFINASDEFCGVGMGECELQKSAGSCFKIDAGLKLRILRGE